MKEEENNLIEKSIDEVIIMANEGDANAINELAYRYFYGEGIEEDKKKAYELYVDASNKGSIKAKFNVAMCYCTGDGIEKNEILSFNILKELAEKHNYYKSYFAIGDFYFFGGPVEIDYEKSFFYYNKALEINPECLEAKYCIAYAYYRGKGVEKDYKIAFDMFTELVDKYEYKYAYFQLGEIYYLGKTGEKDYEKAILYFTKSIEYEKNIYASKYYLGEIYMFGRGVNTDSYKAKAYFEEILNEKYDDAYNKLGLMYTGKYGINKDEEKSKEYFNKIELDLCVTLIYFIFAIKPEEQQNLEEIFRILNSEMTMEMNLLPEYIFQFPEKHPAKLYHDRLSSLEKEEYNNIVESLKKKLLICKDEEALNNELLNISSDEELVNLAKRIIFFEKKS